MCLLAEKPGQKDASRASADLIKGIQRNRPANLQEPLTGGSLKSDVQNTRKVNILYHVRQLGSGRRKGRDK